MTPLELENDDVICCSPVKHAKVSIAPSTALQIRICYRKIKLAKANGVWKHHVTESDTSTVILDHSARPFNQIQLRPTTAHFLPNAVKVTPNVVWLHEYSHQTAKACSYRTADCKIQLLFGRETLSSITFFPKKNFNNRESLFCPL